MTAAKTGGQTAAAPDDTALADQDLEKVSGGTMDPPPNPGDVASGDVGSNDLEPSVPVDTVTAGSAT